jgi:acyl-CoA dehydrogenase
MTEVLARYASPEQQKKWLVPLLNGEIRSAFSMTEKGGQCSNAQLTWLLPHLILVASSDATNIRTSIRQEGNEIVINGHKWFNPFL